MKTIAKHLIPNAGTLILVALLFLAQSVGALPNAAPADILAPSQTLISYQGTLTDPAGNPLTATVTMKFALYDASSSGTLKWGIETQTVQVANGLFHVLLGSATPIDPATLTGDLWLDIKVNEEQLAPRERIGSVVYAVEARTVPDGSITTAKLNINANVDMHGRALLNTASIAAPSTGGFNLLYMQDNDLHLKAGASSGGVYIGKWGNPIPLSVHGNGEFTGQGFFGGATNSGGAMNLRDIGVPLTFEESDTSGAGSLWRMPLDNRALRFDSSDDGIGFPEGGYHKVLTLHPDGSIGCGAITENNLQTEEEQAAGGSDRFEEGDVLCWGIDRLEKCATPNDPLVQAVADEGGRPIVMGAEAIKVLGPVKRGDYLVASSVPGYAMAAANPTFGIVIAQALEDFDGERGVIKAMIRKL